MVKLPAMRLSTISPFGPIFGKEMRTTARRKRTYFLRVLYLGLLLLFLLMVHSSTRPWSYGHRLWQSQQQAELGRAFFLCFSLFCVVSMALLGPILTSTSISAERLGKTLPVLLMTPISAWQIVSGKLFSRLLVALSLIGLSLPVLAVVRLLGGVEAQQMFAVVALCVAQALFAASVGLVLSTLVNRAYAVILQSYAAMFCLYFLFPMLFAFAGARVMGRSGMNWMLVFSASNPIFTTGMLASGEARGMLMVSWQACVATHLAATAGLLWLSAILLRRRERMVSAGEGPSAPAAPSFDSNGVAIPPPPAKPRRERSIYDNPVLWREVRRPLMAKRWQAMMGAILTVGILIFSYWSLSRELAYRDAQIGFAMIFNGLAWLLVAVISATSITTEVESDTWTLLLTTPLSGAQIVRGKVLGLARRLMWPFLLMAGHFLVFTFNGNLNWVQFFLTLWVIITFNLVWVATGTYLSLRCRKVTFAVVLNMLLAVTAYLVVYLVLATIEAIVFQGYRSDHLSNLVTWYLPYFYLGNTIHELNGVRYPTHQTVTMPSGVMLTRGFYTGVVILVGLVHVLLAGIILAYTVMRFDHMVGRAHQRSADLNPA